MHTGQSGAHKPSRIRPSIAAWQVGIWLAAAGTQMHGASPGDPTYFFELWGTDEGLPQSSVAALIQTSDGYLWLGTYGGLVRFDGVRFVVFDAGNSPGLASSRVTALCEDDQRRLWIGHENGKVTIREAGRFHLVPLPESWGTGKVLAICTDGQGRVWLVDEEGMLFEPFQQQRQTPPSGPGRGLVSVVQTDDGRIWIARNGQVSVLENGRLNPISFGESQEGAFVQGICASRQGGLWVSWNGQLRRWAGGRWVEDRGLAPWDGTGVPVMLEMQDGTLVAGTTERGLYLLPRSGPPLHFTRTNGLPQDWIRSVCEDHEGNLWIGVGSAGLMVARASRVWVPMPPDRWQGRAVLTVFHDRDNALWVGTEGAGLYCWQDGQWSRFGNESGLANSFIWSIAEDESGRLWVGTWGGGVFVRDQDGHFRPPVGLEQMSSPVLAMLRGRDGTMWLGTGDGLMRYREGQFQLYGRQQGLQSPDVRALWEGPDGTIWFGMSGGGLGCLRAETLRQWLRKDGLPSDYVQALWMDEHETLWLGTAGEGLVRFQHGRFAVVGPAQGLPNGVIGHIAPDHVGSLWLSSYGGLLRITRTNLEAVANGAGVPLQATVYGRAEGMPTLECSGGLQPAGCRTPDGRLWFATSKGLVGVDPAVIKTNSQPPPVVIEEVRLNGRLLAEPGVRREPVRIPPGRHRLEFRFSGLSFTAPEKVRFRFRLVGVDRDWTEGGRERSAVYQYLPPGDYQFQVTACNNDGLWNPIGASVAFSIAPWFWQTWWFRFAAGLAGAGVVAASVAALARARLRRKLKRLERQQALERERARIAKDMHDELGAGLTRISLLSQTARSELDDPEAVTVALDRIYHTARELTRALDEIVWAVNPKHDTLDSLATYLGRFAQEFLATARVRCRLDVPVQLPPWPVTAEVRHNLFLAFKEALNNAVKHAQATEVRIALQTDTNAFTLCIEDDGRGFNPSVLKGASSEARNRTGHGLQNMHQRMADVGGQCQIQSRAAGGTSVLFIVPRGATHA
ncbi:MAG: two-component regulator propeller domain-containing protein [Verrucomicrobiota bacterium]|nr:ATP-binding protein [Limisphaera sp.]MDW8382302.1 two-component regulator propeller domain-containing protein [Verrucomicrobiota bacterium]